jgi:hypothetical protein
MAVDSQVHNLDLGLIHVVFLDEIDARGGAGKHVMADWGGLDRRKAFKCSAQFGLHGNGVEVAADAHNQFAGNGAVMPGLQVIDGDGADGGQFGLAGVGAVRTVDQLGRFAFGNC